MSDGIRVTKHGARLPVSVELLLEPGEITEEQARSMGWTAPPRPPRCKRWRWALSSWWFAHRPHIHLGPCNHEDCL